MSTKHKLLEEEYLVPRFWILYTLKKKKKVLSLKGTNTVFLEEGSGGGREEVHHSLDGERGVVDGT